MLNSELPLVIAGPILRHVAHDTVTVWLVTSDAVSAKIKLLNESELESVCQQHQWIVGTHCHINIVRLSLQAGSLTDGKRYFYDVELLANEQSLLASELCPGMRYVEHSSFSFVFKSKITNLIHGSCRKPHYPAPDSLPQLANLLAPSSDIETRPDLVIFTGDQVYVDDVAGPTLYAVQRCINLLGLYHEEILGSTIKNSRDLIGHPYCFYRRSDLLPEVDANQELEEVFFKSKKKPVFTSINADNHLIALNEMIALYLLTWSSRLWPLITIETPNLEARFSERYAIEKQAVDNFVEGLNQVEKAFAHVPIYMIFDDHDITDDWNLTRAWEEQVYGNPYSKRIIGNALCAYFLCQGAGNPAHSLSELFEAADRTFTDKGLQQHDSFIDLLLDFEHWHYSLQTTPPIQVLDTRTQRWRSESKATKPSGLMDWEGLCELQQHVIGKDSVILVSAAPIYGVKFIEAVQKFFTFFGGALLVDAENWMAHNGTANVMLNIFTHQKTPPNFIILSGDVHYSFVYDITLRFRKNSPKILQFTCSGIHNEFPNRLLRWFDRLNHFFYSHRSPLNFLTKRRNMSIRQRQPIGFDGDLVNRCALGLLRLNQDGTEQACTLILADGTTINFTADTNKE